MRSLDRKDTARKATQIGGGILGAALLAYGGYKLYKRLKGRKIKKMAAARQPDLPGINSKPQSAFDKLSPEQQEMINKLTKKRNKGKKPPKYDDETFLGPEGTYR